jgi:hypothetical protein
MASELAENFMSKEIELLGHNPILLGFSTFLDQRFWQRYDVNLRNRGANNNFKNYFL